MRKMGRLQTDRRDGRSVRRWRRGRAIEASGIGQWFAGRKAVFVFLLIFGVLMGVFYAFISWAPFFGGVFVPRYHHFIATVSGWILSFLVEDTTVSQAGIFSPRFSGQIAQGCDAIEATGLLMCAIIAFPAGLLQKVAGIVAGAFALAVLNLVRIVSLFLIGIHLPRIVDFMHIEVWQGLFIIFAVMLWVLWLLWIARNPTQIQTVSASKPSRS
jgi:exosortase/archaeosortase family protein